ncbi:MAG: iron ABC transporter permease [Lachnospiraceae bacterium]|nr:iron ABC transporter permease [Lachnospiraceae bacterium]
MKKKAHANSRIFFLLSAVLLVLLILLGLGLGSVRIPLREILRVLSEGDAETANAVILRSVRLPRVLAGILTGAGLGAAGAILQTVLNNSLASSNTIGVNSGAGFFVMLSMIFFPKDPAARSGMAFLGALITVLFILCLAYFAERSRVTIILAGITISSFLSAAMNLIKTLDDSIVINSLTFSIGSLAGVRLSNLAYPAIGILPAILIATLLGKALNIMSLGDGTAMSLGLKVHHYRIVFVLLASLLAGCVVSYAGLISFVGLIVPHVCRYFTGHDARVLIPASALLGAVFVLIADLAGRVLFAPYELPVGILLSLSGAPFFLYLLLKKGGRRVNA